MSISDDVHVVPNMPSTWAAYTGVDPVEKLFGNCYKKKPGENKSAKFQID